MKIAHYILLSFFVILLLFSITTYMNYRQSKAVKENTEFVARSGQVIRATNRFQRNILNMMSGLRGYLLTGEKYFIESYDSAAIENDAILKSLGTLISDTSLQKRNLIEIESLNNKWVTDFAEPLRTAKMLANESDTDLENFKRIYRQKLNTREEQDIQKRLSEKFKTFSNYEYEYRDISREKLNESVRYTGKISFFLTISSIVISVVIVLFLAYTISARIRMMVTLANEISSGNYKVEIEDTGKDELSKLSESLNHMAKTLSENISLLKRKNEELDQFAHIVSHDLKGPLRGIDNVVTWIEEDHKQEITPKVGEYLELIKGRITRAENLIEGILSYARIDKETIQKEYIPVSDLVNELLEDLPIPGTLTIEVQKDMPVVFSEKLPLVQVFSNLISNAIKYHDKPKGLIKVYSKEHTDHYEFFVEDNGPGIAKHYHDKIFVIFQTLKDRDSFESTGVGLAIIKKILEARKETIHLTSEPGKGSVFSFTWTK